MHAPTNGPAPLVIVVLEVVPIVPLCFNAGPSLRIGPSCLLLLLTVEAERGEGGGRVPPHLREGRRVRQVHQRTQHLHVQRVHRVAHGLALPSHERRDTIKNLASARLGTVDQENLVPAVRAQARRPRLTCINCLSRSWFRADRMLNLGVLLASPPLLLTDPPPVNEEVVDMGPRSRGPPAPVEGAAGNS